MKWNSGIATKKSLVLMRRFLSWRTKRADGRARRSSVVRVGIGAGGAEETLARLSISRPVETSPRPLGLAGNTGDTDAGGGDLVALIQGDQHRRERLGRGRVREYAGVPRPEPDVAREADHRVGGGPIIAADQYVALDDVVQILQMMRGDVLERRDDLHLVAEQPLDRLDGRAAV